MNVEKKEDEYFINKHAIGELFDSKFDLNVCGHGSLLSVFLWLLNSGLNRLLHNSKSKKTPAAILKARPAGVSLNA